MILIAVIFSGFYVPSLAARVLENPATQIFKQLTGIMVGNPVFFCGTGSNSTIQVDIFYWHGLVSYENYQAYLNNGCNANPNSGTCSNIINSMLVSLLLLFCSKTVPPFLFFRYNEVGEIDQEVFAAGGNVFNAPSLDPDDLYQNFCVGTLFKTIDFNSKQTEVF